MEVKMAGQISIAHKGTFREHSPLGIIGAASGALIAAFMGAVLWGQLAVWTGSELAWLAIGIGVIAGLVTRLLASNEQNVSIQLLAASAALVGVIVGKYYIFALFLKAAITDAFGAQAATEFSLFSSATFTFLQEDTGAVVGALDAVWLGLALFIAWRIPQSIVVHWRRGQSS
jgi:hypothetical protein